MSSGGDASDRGVVAAVLAAVASVALVVALACGGAQKAAAPATPAATEPAGMPDNAHAEIEQLDRQIATDLARGQIAPAVTTSCTGAACEAAVVEPFATPTARDPSCHPAESGRCGDLCTLSDTICRNQQRICDLAKQLPGDDWAANKCTSARASCEAAHERCCSCA